MKNRQTYLEMGLCVIGVVEELNRMLDEPMFDLSAIISDVYDNKMTILQMIGIMKQTEEIFELLEEMEDEEDEEAGCDCDNCPINNICHSKEEDKKYDKEEPKEEVTEVTEEAVVELIGELTGVLGELFGVQVKTTRK